MTIEHAEVKFRETRFGWSSYQVTLERTDSGYEVTFWRPEDVQTIDYTAVGKDGNPEIFASQTQNQHQFVVMLDKKSKVVGTQMCCK